MTACGSAGTSDLCKIVSNRGLGAFGIDNLERARVTSRVICKNVLGYMEQDVRQENVTREKCVTEG